MNRRIALLPSLLAIALLCLPAVASAQAEHQRNTQDIYFNDLVYNDCAGEFVLITGLDQFRLQWTWDGAGNIHVSYHENFVGVTGIGDSGTEYQVIGTVGTGGANGSPDGRSEGTFVVIFSLVSHGSSDNLRIMAFFHAVFDSDGSLKLEKDHFEATCRG
jgi:hypothetical protein